MTWLPWIGFLSLIGLLLALDLGVLNRRPHVISAREALLWTGLWIAVALAFDGLVYTLYEHELLGFGGEIGAALSGREAALEFLAGYVVEKSLSVDNIFVIALIFSYFRLPAELQHRVLFWGVLGALLLRGVMIAGGLAIIEAFSWTAYLFGGLLLATAGKMLFSREESVEPERNPVVRLVRRWFPVTDDYRGERFFVREGGKLAATPLCLALAMVESTDVIFAIDSIPAVFAVTRDPFIIYTSNVFAILGLRSLYFALAAVLHRFRFIKTSLVLLLAFIGVKMILAHHLEISTVASLIAIAAILGAGVVASVIADRAFRRQTELKVVGSTDPTPRE